MESIVIITADDPNSDHYPIQISMTSEFIQRWLPLMMTSLSVMKGVDGIAEMARLLAWVSCA